MDPPDAVVPRRADARPRAHAADRQRPGTARHARQPRQPAPTGNGEVDFALVQADTTLEPGDPSISAVRLVAVLHENVLQFVVRSPEVRSIDDLRDKLLYLGPPESGTRQLAERVLTHFGLIVDGKRQYQEPAGEAAPTDFDGCAVALRDGRIDAACFASGLPTPWVRECFTECPTSHLLPLGTFGDAGSALEGIRMAAPPLDPVAVPARTYGDRPLAPVGTITVATLFVANKDVPEDVVKEVTRQLFENRSALLKAHAGAARFAEQPDVNRTPYPWHPGAWAHYHRNAPSWFVQYSETLSFGLTTFVLVGSGLITLRGIMRRRRKNRIDVYYLELESLADRLQSAGNSLPEIRTVTSQLHGLRRRAYTELVAEQLEADASFVIFQDYLLAELATADRHARQAGSDSPAD
ncbi:MAG: TAXI family TRAP transporter solute-binding subunit [Planctomycetota bacterium]